METSITIKKNYFTSIEQSSKLYKLGLDSKTADMAYVIRRDDCRVPWEKAAEDEKNIFVYLWQRASFNLSDYVLPCWSLGALLELIPKVFNGQYPLLIRDNNGKWFMQYENSVRYDTAVECVFMFLCYCFENKIIK